MAKLEIPSKEYLRQEIEKQRINPFLPDTYINILGEEIYNKYVKKLLTHLIYISWFGRQLDLPYSTIKIHDKSKFSKVEFIAYAKYFCDGKKEEDKPAFARAWVHHVGNNPHHWEHWCLPNNYSFGGAINGCVEMPKKYVDEMIVDWISASYQYEETIDMTNWLKFNLPKIKLHPKSLYYLESKLEDLGYDVNELYGEIWK